MQLRAAPTPATPTWPLGYEVGGLDDPFALHLTGPVQARSEAALDPTRVAAHASRGIAGPGAPLPHLGAIEAAFGPHDVSGVRAHVGGEAADAAHAIGAVAYATGADVAFAQAPDLHTAAHEAAHVVQQRAGVSLKGGVGQAGDPYEQHADAVADAVVAGQSATALLDAATAAGGGASAAPQVQRQADDVAAVSDVASVAGGIVLQVTMARLGVEIDHLLNDLRNRLKELVAALAGLSRRRLFAAAFTDGGPRCRTNLKEAKPSRRPGATSRRGIARPTARCRPAPDKARFDSRRGRDLSTASFTEAFSVGAQPSRAKVGLGRDPRRLSDSDRTAVKAALRAADGFARRLGPGAQQAIHPGVLAVEAAAKRRGATIDVLTDRVLADQGADADPETLRKTVARSGRQLDRAAGQLAAWQLDDAVARLQSARGRLRWAEVGLTQPGGLPTERRTIALLQATTLFEAAGEIDGLLSLAQSSNVEPNSREHDVFGKVLAAYALAMANADLDPDPLAAARFGKQRLPLNLTRASIEAGRAALDGLRQDDPQQAQAADRAYDRLSGKVHRLDGDLHDGKSVDPSAIADVAIAARELDFRNRALAMEAQLESLAALATKADEGWVAFFANAYAVEFKALPGKLRDIKQVVAGFRAGHNQNVHDASAKVMAKTTDVGQRARQLVQVRADSLTFIEGELGRWLATSYLHDNLKHAIAAINDAQTRAVVTELAAQTALMIALGAGAGAVASVVGRGVAGGVMGASVVEGAVASAGAVRAARVAGAVAQVVTDAALSTAGQKLLLGDEGSWLSVFTTNAAVAVALRPLHGLFARWGSAVDQAEVRSLQLWKARGKVVLRAGVELSIEMVSAAAVDYTVRRAQHEQVHGLDEQTATQWLLTGASMAIGRFISGRMTGLEERLGTLAAHATYNRVHAIKARAATRRLEVTGRAPDALDAMVAYHAALDAEHEAIVAAKSDGQHPLDPRTLATVEAGHDAASAELQSAAFEQLPLRLAGLEPDNAAGLVWRGGREDIAEALAAAKDAGVDAVIEVTGSEGRPWLVTYGSRRLEIFEEAARPSKPARPRRARATAVGAGTDAEAGRAPPTAAREPTPAEQPPTADVAAGRDRVMLVGDDHYLRIAAERVRPLPGYVDVIVHGATDSFAVVRTHDDVRVDQRAFATYLRKHGLGDQKIRLIACEAGKHPKGVAQHLSNALGVEVLAPSDTAWIDASGTVGVGARDRDTGTWLTFRPTKSEPRMREISPLAAERSYRTEDADGAEIDPVEVRDPRFDHRARIAPSMTAALGAELGAVVIIDDGMTNGVEVRARRVKQLFGFDLEVVQVRVGRDALVADVLAHQATIANLERYNGVVGKLRGLIDQLRAWRKGGQPTTFAHGTRGWVTEQELGKLDDLLAGRVADLGQGRVDSATLVAEIEFLQGRREFHADTLAAMVDTGHLHDPTATIAGPDVGQVTREAEAAGYRLPGPADGVEPGWYYYRHKAEAPSEYVLVLRPTAPADAPSLRARVVAGEFTGFEAPPRAAGAALPYEWTPQQVVEHLRQTVGFTEYALMLESHGIASRAVIDGVVGRMRGRRVTDGKPVTTDQVRRDVKDYFRDRVVAKLLDPALDAQASWQQMRAIVGDLPPADRGTLVEAWYLGRHAPGAKPHVAVGVARTSGDNEGKVESRVIDAMDGTTAVEIKDGDGPTDRAQFGAYLDMLEGGVRAGKAGTQIKKLKYVFTKPEGAIANLEFMAQELDRQRLAGRVTVEVFDAQGRLHVVRTADEALALVDTIRKERF